MAKAITKETVFADVRCSALRPPSRASESVASPMENRTTIPTPAASEITKTRPSSDQLTNGAAGVVSAIMVFLGRENGVALG